MHHARHDFIMANDDASREVKDAIRVLHNDIDEKYLRIKGIQDKSLEKHAQIILSKDQELSRITQHFSLLKKALQDRE